MNMKSVMKFATLVLLVSLFASCGETIPLDVGYSKKNYSISIDKNLLTFSSSGGEVRELRIAAQNVSWEITGVPQWLTLSAVSGVGSATITVVSAKNEEIDEARTAVLTLKATGKGFNYSQNISVTQDAPAIYINPSATSLAFSGVAATKSITIDSNVNWEPATSAAWLTLTKQENTLQVAVSENITSSSRTATISLKREGTTVSYATVTVTQSEPGVTGSSDELQFTISGGTKDVDIAADVSWSAYTSAPEWLSVSPESGASGAHRLVVSALPNNTSNSRNGFVYVKIGSTDKLSIPVVQEGLSLKVNGTLDAFSWDNADAQKLTVVSNAAWKMLSAPEWVAVTPDNGNSGTTEISISVTKNRALNGRSGTLRIGIENVDVYQDITIEQNGLDVALGDSHLNFDWEASQQDYEIALPNAWSAMVSDTWLTLSQYSGNGGETIVIGVQTNDSEDVRTATITLVTEGRTYNITVTQQGQYLKINTTAGEVSAMGGTVSLTVNSSVGAKQSIEYQGEPTGWLSVEQNESTYTLKAEYNPSIEERTAVFVIKPTMSTTNGACTAGVKFNLTQKGRALSTNVAKIEISAFGGTSATYSIKADGKYSISKVSTDNWYVLSHDAASASFNVVVSENKTDGERTSQITLSLSELPEGEAKEIAIELVQYAGGVYVDIGGFDEDKSWD